MKDRVPGAPGQYKAVVTEAELQKMHTGEQFTITMTRDDQPVVDGTPYSKAAVLPDTLAQILCPGMDDPTPADALAALLPKSGGTMTGNLDMGEHSINANLLNNARIRCFKSTDAVSTFRVDRTVPTDGEQQKSVYLIISHTSGCGPCVYVADVENEQRNLIKIAGGEYSTVGFSVDDTSSVTIHTPKWSHCCVVGLDRASII